MDEEIADLLKDEVNILRTLDHPNSVQIYEYFDEKRRFYIVMECVKGGELFDEIVSRKYF